MVYIIDTQSDLENYNKTVDLTSDSLLNCRLYYNIRLHGSYNGGNVLC